MNDLSSNIDFGRLKIEDLPSVFYSEDRGLLEEMALAARELTRRYFGRTISLYAPLYISNYCQNECVYCGFHASNNGMPRSKLSIEQIENECSALASTGIRSCLILTGESRLHSSPGYIGEAVEAAKKYFPYIALEVYPLEENEYRQLYLAGVDVVQACAQMGHADVSTTLRIYTHLDAIHKRKSVDKLDAYLSGNSKAENE